MAEHDAAFDAAGEHLVAKPSPTRPLGPLPPESGETTSGLHFVAEHLLQPKRRLETGRGFLGFTPGGFGSLLWERGEASGEPGSVRVEGVELISNERRERGAGYRSTTSGAVAHALGIDADDPALGRDARRSTLTPPRPLGRLVRVRDGRPRRADRRRLRTRIRTRFGSGPSTSTSPRWSAQRTAGTRANVGASPGDDDHPEPYLYVGPWDAVGEAASSGTPTGSPAPSSATRSCSPRRTSSPSRRSSWRRGSPR